MVPNTPTTDEKAGVPRKVSVKNRIEENPLWAVLVALVLGFGSGIGSYRELLEITNQETVIKGTVIPKKDLVGPILKNEAGHEIESLIESGQSLGNDEDKTRGWLMQVLAFIHGIKLEKDSSWQGQPMSAIEADIRFALTDPSIKFQAQKTLGILKGFRSALQTRVSD